MTSTLRLRAQNAEVFYTDADPVLVGGADLHALKAAAAASPRRRARICTHERPESRLHEMLIVLQHGSYIRPHRHLNRTESFSIIEGEAEVILFEDDGAVRAVIPMGAPGSGRTFYYRLAKPTYHSVVVRSESLVFLEVTDGPFNPQTTEFAEWAPTENEPETAAQFLDSIRSLTASCPTC